MSRTIGDFMFKHSLTNRNCSSFDYALSNEADVKEFQFNKTKIQSESTDQTGSSTSAAALEFILIGCDGIWEGAIS